MSVAWAIVLAFAACTAQQSGAALTTACPPGFTPCGKSSCWLQTDGTSCATSCAGGSCAPRCTGKDCRPMLEFEPWGSSRQQGGGAAPMQLPRGSKPPPAKEDPATKMPEYGKQVTVSAGCCAACNAPPPLPRAVAHPCLPKHWITTAEWPPCPQLCMLPPPPSRCARRAPWHLLNGQCHSSRLCSCLLQMKGNLVFVSSAANNPGGSR